MPHRARLLTILTAIFLLHAAPSAIAQTASFDSYLNGLRWRHIGPANMGGRIDDFAVVPGKPAIFYVATASGGIFKTTNGGVSFDPIFDNESTSSVGDIELSPANPEIVWAGTGESNNRQSSSWGDGVFKSMDGGKTWTNVGLRETHHIGRIVAHPTNSDIVWVAATGRLWGPNPERGVYKTTDGGKTWDLCLKIDEDTGATDIAIDPSNPDVLYAAMYQRRRTAFGYNGGGSKAGLFKTTDGGKTWAKLAGGLPTGDVGRIAVDVYAKNSKIVYCTVETRQGPATGSAMGDVFRSEDAGATWTKVSGTNQRPMYFSQIRVDPNNDQVVWMAGLPMYYSENGGKTWSTNRTNGVHVDFHAFWIDPANSDHLLSGSDGGIHQSWDRGKSWIHHNTIALAQFYEVHFDFRKPYWVSGGLQDNGSWNAPSSVPYVDGIDNSDWISVGGGDGFYAQADPLDWTVLYTESQQGALARWSVSTGERKSIRPRALPGQPALRFDWNTPILISPHNNKKLLVGANRLFISYDRGDSWRGTDDLSGNPDRTKMPILGQLSGPTTLAINDGQDSFGQIVTLTESSKQEGVIYIGTDDGFLQVSRDDGKTWKNVAPNAIGVPKGTYVSRVQASAFEAGRVYATFDGHRSNDFKPYIYVSEDFGESWRPIANGIPEFSTLSVIREHPKNGNVLFAGTERGVYFSIDRGASWKMFGKPLPMVPVDDIQIHPRDNDLILGTHGRGIIILDDIAPIQQMAEAQAAPVVYLFDLRPAVAYRQMQRREPYLGSHRFSSTSAPVGAVIQYFLKTKPTATEPLKVEIFTKDGKTLVRTLRTAPEELGVNRATWDLRYAPPNTGGGGGFGGGFGGGPRALPGDYLVRVSVGKTVQEKLVKVEEDPRLNVSDKDRKAGFDLAMRLSKLVGEASETTRTLDSLRSNVTSLETSDAFKSAPDPIKKRVSEFSKKIAVLTEKMQAGGVVPLSEEDDEEEEEERAYRKPGFDGRADIEEQTQQAGNAQGQGERQGRGGAGQAGQPGRGAGQAGQPGGSGGQGGPGGGRRGGGGLSGRAQQLLANVTQITEAPSKYSKEQTDKIAVDVASLSREVNNLMSRDLPALNKELKAANLPEIKAPTKATVS
jgi:photosystem II stability/assembly factor-like uncharacterized protein